MMIDNNLDMGRLKFDEKGLITAVVQHEKNGNVLMVAYMNRESLAMTLETGKATFFSRSRNELWIKGDTSGNYLYVSEIKDDCDSDCLLVLADPVGPSCHTGSYSCFGEANLFNGYVVDMLEKTVKDRIESMKYGSEEAKSYTVKLLQAGTDRILRKIGEEATETIIAAKNKDNAEVVYETSDLIFHLMVLLGSEGISFDEISEELYSRHGKAHGLPKTRV
jgi:phosphoribosyl-AMP cyclohydrolase / phosphoribosyl-ATP pyrophosphohydrolase